MEAETHRYGKLEWLFYIVVLPLLFTALLSGIILQFLGVDVTGKIASGAKQIPGVSYLFPSEEQAMPVTAEAEEQQKQELNDQMQALESENKQLEEDLTKKNAEIDRLKKQVDSLKKAKEGDTGAGASATSVEPKTVDPLTEQANVYAEMSSSKAAAIMVELSASEAKRILDKMNSEQKASILEKMEPAIAAQILAAK